MRIVLPEPTEYNIGGLLYFFEKACGISGYLLGVNPFNQPGVEAYKRICLFLLNKPGYEEESKAIQARLQVILLNRKINADFRKETFLIKKSDLRESALILRLNQ